MIATMSTPGTIQDLRYPIGDFSPPSADNWDTRAKNIEVIRLLPERLKAAVAGLTDSQLDTPYREGGWTVGQTVHHVADSHLNAYVRFKLALTEDWPTVKPYEEALWAKLADSRLPVELSLNILTALHLRWVALLESMTDADFEKGYVHPGIKENGGRQPLWEVLALYAWHSQHHTAHIANLRSRMGW
jgi:uncharacterized damage-inducible protein DinB